MIGPIDFGPIENLADKAWEVMKGSQPLYSAQSPPVANAVPQRIPFEKLSHWSPRPRIFRLRYSRDLMGKEPVRLIFRYSFWFGGRYQGHGQFIRNATVHAEDGHVAPLQRVDVSFKADTAVNIGTVEDPIAALDTFTDVQHRFFYLLRYPVNIMATMYGNGTWHCEYPESVKVAETVATA